MSFKKLVAATAVSVGLVYVAPSYAQTGVCGWGKIVEVREGGFDSNDLYVRLDASARPADANVANTEWRFLR